MIELEDRRPLYRRLRDQIAQEIVKNRWGPGQQLPTEAVFISKYNVSSGTIKKALDILEADGLIERIQGSGTFVRRPDWSNIHTHSIRYFGSAGDQRPLRSRIFAREALSGPPEVTSVLQLEPHARVIHLRRLRSHDGLPVLTEEIWLGEEQFAPLLTTPDTEQPLLYPLYERLCGVSVARAKESITIEAAGPPDAEMLGLIEGRPMVLISRIAYGYDDRPVEWRHSRGPASDFYFETEIR